MRQGKACCGLVASLRRLAIAYGPETANLINVK